MDLNDAAVFARVVESGSFTRAARLLHHPKSSVSRAVARLEEELGVRLLHRTTRSLSLTEAGQAFYDRARGAMAGLEEAASAARELKLPETLRFIGHRYQEVTTLADLRTAIETGRYNIVLADFGAAGAVERELGPSSARVVFVPVAYKPTKAEAREAARQQRFLIKAPSRAVEYLATIAEAVAFRSAGPRKG